MSAKIDRIKEKNPWAVIDGKIKPGLEHVFNSKGELCSYRWQTAKREIDKYIKSQATKQ